MKTAELRIQYPDSFEEAVHLTKAELEQNIRLMAALKMFELGKVSSGKGGRRVSHSRLPPLLRPEAGRRAAAAVRRPAVGPALRDLRATRSGAAASGTARALVTSECERDHR